MVNGARQRFFTTGSDPIIAGAQADGLAYGLLQRHATMLAFVDDFWLMGLTFLALIPLMFLMKKGRPHQAPGGEI